MKASDIKKDIQLWIPCEVRGGPFPNERRVFVETDFSKWFGFVDLSELRDEDGKKFVRAVVLAVGPTHIVLGICGQSPANGPIKASPSLITEYGSIAS
jgi:hypothetical protein